MFAWFNSVCLVPEYLQKVNAFRRALSTVWGTSCEALPTTDTSRLQLCLQGLLATNIVSLQTSFTSEGASSTWETSLGDSEHLVLSTSEDLNSDTTADWDKESEACECNRLNLTHQIV